MTAVTQTPSNKSEGVIGTFHAIHDQVYTKTVQEVRTMLERAFRDPSKHIQIISNSNKSRTGAAYLPVRIQHFVWDPPHIDFESTCCQSE